MKDKFDPKHSEKDPPFLVPVIVIVSLGLSAMIAYPYIGSFIESITRLCPFP